MDDTERRTAKRSRFDQTEPEPKRASRFDRRSKSPPAVKPSTESRRSRSPLPTRSSRSSETPPADNAKKSVDPAAAAAAAAARINALINAKKAADQIDDTPARSQSPGPRSPAVATGIATGTVGTVNGDMYIADGDYIRDIEVNDLRNRYTLTKGSTQKMIKDETGADVTTRGSYFPDKTLATAANPPLYLHVTSTSKAGLEKAVEKINELMQQELPNLVDERRFRRREPEQFERDEFGRRKWPEEKIEIPFESVPGFNLRAQVVGHGGAYVKYIQQETRCRVQIKGRGSGFMEHGTGIESEEDMYLHVAGPDPVEVQRAKTLCLELLENVKQQYEEFKLRPPPQRNYGEGRGGYGGEGRGGYGGEGRGGYNGGNTGYGGDRNQERSNSYGGGGHSAGGYGGYSNSPAPPTPGSNPMSPPNQSTGADPNAAYAAQYAQYYAQNGGDPYAAYGGYEAYVQYYQQWYASQGGAQQQPQGPPGAPPSGSAPPPPPPSEGPPGSSQAPPPPPSGPPSSAYNAVPPPPGL